MTESLAEKVLEAIARAEERIREDIAPWSVPFTEWDQTVEVKVYQARRFLRTAAVPVTPYLNPYLLLAHCGTHRKLVALHSEFLVGGHCACCGDVYPCDTVRLVAATYDVGDAPEQLRRPARDKFGLWKPK